MILLSPSFLLGILLLLYLSTFIIFAIIRVVTGISIQRVGLSGLRRISFVPKEGLRIDIRGLGLSFHSPTIAQPTWISIRLDELKVSVDLTLLGKASTSVRTRNSRWQSWRGVRFDTREEEDTVVDPAPAATASGSDIASDLDAPSSRRRKRSAPSPPISRAPTATAGLGNKSTGKVEALLARGREKLKVLHKQMFWLQVFDVMVTKVSIHVLDICQIDLDSAIVVMNGGREMTSEGASRQRIPGMIQAKWVSIIRGLHLAPDGGAPILILDDGTFTFGGLFRIEGAKELRDAAMEVTLGNIDIKADAMKEIVEKAKRLRQESKGEDVLSEMEEMSASDADSEGGEGITEGEAATDEPDADDYPSTLESDCVEADDLERIPGWPELSKELLEAVQNIQLTVSSAVFHKRMLTPGVGSGVIDLTTSLTKLWLDLSKLDPDSTTHMTYFSKEDVVHQAFLSAFSVAVLMDDNTENTGARPIMTVPMMDATIRTTVPAKFVELLGRSKEPREAFTQVSESMLSANLVVKYPSVDLYLKHLPILMSISNSNMAKKAANLQRGYTWNPSIKAESESTLLSELLPRASIQTNIHEPVIRVMLEAPKQADTTQGHVDILIGTMTSIGLDIDASHTQNQGLHYEANTIFRMSAPQFYYQIHDGDRHSVLVADSLDIKSRLTSTPNVGIEASANASLQHCGVHLVHSKVGYSINRIINELASRPRTWSRVKSQRESFLRRFPAWIVSFKLKCVDFSVEIAGVDQKVSSRSKGLALHVEQWGFEYVAEKKPEYGADLPRMARRRGSSRILTPEDFSRTVMSSPTTPFRNGAFGSTDGRRMVLGLNSVAVYVITGDGGDEWDPVPLVDIPQTEVVIETKTEKENPVCTISATIEAVYIQYNLFRHYAAMIVLSVLKQTFSRGTEKAPTFTNSVVSIAPPDIFSSDIPLSARSTLSSSRLNAKTPRLTSDYVTCVVAVNFFQAKIDGPVSLPILFQAEGGEFSYSPFKSPSISVASSRLCIPTPKNKEKWSRLVEIHSLRVDLHLLRKGLPVEDQYEIISDLIRVSVPNQVAVYPVIDTFVTLAKTVKELSGRVKPQGWSHTENEEEDVEIEAKLKGPQQPIRLPSLRFRIQNVQFELEDDPFEWRLGLIYRLGKDEQIQRLAREVVFKKKCPDDDTLPTVSQLRRSRSLELGQKLGKAARSHSEDAIHQSLDRPGTETKNYKPVAGAFVPEYQPDVQFGTDRTRWVPFSEARARLEAFNSRSWKMRVDEAIAKHRRSRDPGLLFAADEESAEQVGMVPGFPPLLNGRASDVDIRICPPSFGPDGHQDFVSRMGRGMPKTMTYSLLVPFGLAVSFGTLDVSLRDYPLKLLSVPQGGLEMVTDFVIGEEYRDKESVRWIDFTVVEPDEGGKGLHMKLPKTISTVKSYSDMTIRVCSPGSTKITWAASYQAALQDIIRVIEGFTKQPIDTSERMGFWDKIRLTFHSRMNITWVASGDLQLLLKGSRDPYLITGDGAGFAFCWGENVSWRIGDGGSDELMIIESGKFFLRVPDFGPMKLGTNDDMNESGYGKTVMKLTGKVRWQWGLVFGRVLRDGRESFDFSPHYSVVLKNPEFCSEGHDAYAGFRSDFIHMIVALSAGGGDGSSYNSVHLSPQLFTHFFSWWALFSGVLSLPVRQGPLWPGLPRSSRKFGRHLSKINYSFDFDPVYMAHTYRHADIEGAVGCEGVTGLKVRVSNLNIELEQERQNFTQVLAASRFLTKQQLPSMKVQKAIVDCVSADVRALESRLYAPDLDPDGKSSHLNGMFSVDVHDSDSSWFDTDDFRELDMLAMREQAIATKVLRLLYSPRLTYDREVRQKGGRTMVKTTRVTPRQVQVQLIASRVRQVEEQQRRTQRRIGELELQILRMELRKEDGMGAMKRLRDMEFRLGETKKVLHQLSSVFEGENRAGEESSSITDFGTDFENRFVVHNAQVKWNNALRNIILRYLHQASRRRGLVYYGSRKAVQFLFDIVEEQRKKESSGHSHSRSGTSFTEPRTATENIREPEEDKSLDDLTEMFSYHVRFIAPQIQLLSEKNPTSVVLATATNMELKIVELMDPARLLDDVSGLIQRQYIATMDRVQIFVTSELSWSRSMEASMSKKDRLGSWPPWVPLEGMYDFGGDPLGFMRVVQRTSATLKYTKSNALRVGVNGDKATHGNLPTNGISIEFPELRATCDSAQYYAVYIIVLDLLLYAEPLERDQKAKLDKILLASDFSDLSDVPERVELLQKRLGQLQEIRTEFLHRARSGLSDGGPGLLGLEGWRSLAGLEKDLTRVKDELFYTIKAVSLSKRRQGAAEVDPEGRYNEFVASQNLDDVPGILHWTILVKEVEWFLIRGELGRTPEPLVKFRLSDARYDRVDQADGSNRNSIKVRSIDGENKLTDALFPRMIERYHPTQKGTRGAEIEASRTLGSQMVRVDWRMLEAIGGIPIIFTFEVWLVPLKVQLERDVGVKLFEYIFPTKPDGEDEADIAISVLDEGDLDSEESDESSSGTSFNSQGIKDGLLPARQFPHVGPRHPSVPSSGSSALSSAVPFSSPAPASDVDSQSQHQNRRFGLKAALTSWIPRSKAATSSNEIPDDARSVQSKLSSRSHKKGSLFGDLGPASSKTADSQATATTTTRKRRNKLWGSAQETVDDDVSQMLQRAAQYRTLAHVKISEVFLQLSYKGQKGKYNIEDVTNLQVRLPTLQYHNKVWSNYDLAIQLRKEVQRVILTHATAFLGQKFRSHDEPSGSGSAASLRAPNESPSGKGQSQELAGPDPDGPLSSQHHHHHHHHHQHDSNQHRNWRQLIFPTRPSAPSSPGNRLSDSMDGGVPSSHALRRPMTESSELLPHNSHSRPHAHPHSSYPASLTSTRPASSIGSSLVRPALLPQRPSTSAVAPGRLPSTGYSTPSSEPHPVATAAGPFPHGHSGGAGSSGDRSTVSLTVARPSQPPPPSPACLRQGSDRAGSGEQSAAGGH